MRDWTKAMAALLAAVSTVGLVQISVAQDATTLPTATVEKPAASGEAEPAVKADDADPFAGAAPVQGTGRDLTKEELKIDDQGVMDLHVSSANLVDVLRTISMQTRKNIVVSKNVGGKVSANLYGVTVREALDAILHANGYAYREKGNFIYVYTVDELKRMEKDERRTTTEVFRLNYTPGASALEMIRPAMSPDGNVAVSRAATVGLASNATDAGGNSFAIEDTLVVTDYADNVAQIRRIVKELDRRPQQILVEATILQARLTDENSLGVDFSIMGGVDFATLGTTNTAVLATNNTGDLTATGDPEVFPAAAAADNGYGAIGTNVKGANSRGLNIGVAYNNIGMFINALEETTDTVVLANPKVLTLNKQPGTVIVGRKDGYLTTTTTTTTTTQTVEYLETGTRLIFRPFIGDDGFIRMEIHPEDSSGGLLGSGLPFKQTTEVTTNVMVKDGHTIVIGGLFREENSVRKSQVPFLGNIPYAGQLFRQQGDTARREEVIILITPHIIKDESVYADESGEMLKMTDMVRVGLRKGMMPWGRDRLAEMAYEKARDEMGKPYYDRERAMWYLNCATNLNPAFTEALAAKQQVSGKMLMESDNSSIRYFLRDRVAEGQGVSIETPVVAPAPTVVVPAEPAPAPAVQVEVQPKK